MKNLKSTNMRKLIFIHVCVCCLMNVKAQLPTNATGNTLVNGTTASNASVASTNSAGFKLSIQGAQINWGTGVNTVTSPTHYFRNTTATTGKIWAINSDNTGLFTISDATGTTTPLTHSNRLVINGSGNVGIGTAAPTAALHLKAGTATANNAPLKFTSGTNLTTAEAGAMEYSGTVLSFSPSAGVRKEIAFTDLSNVAGPVPIAKGGTGTATGAGLNLIFAGPAATAAGAPLFRAMVTNDIPNTIVTYPKMQNVTAGRLLGNGGTVAGPVTEITIGSGLSLSGTTLSATGGGGSSQWTTSGSNIYYNTVGGNVGIGTATPGSKLDVAGVTTITGGGGSEVAAGGKIQLVSGYGSSISGRVLLGDGTGWKMHFSNRLGVGTINDLVTFTDAGNVGIGTSVPTKKLDVAGEAVIKGGLYMAYADAGVFPNGTNWINFHHNRENINGFSFSGMAYSNGDGVIHTTTNTSVVNSFGTHFLVRSKIWNAATSTYDYTERFAINNSGSVGIGTITPNSNFKLDVQGNGVFTGKLAIGTTDMAKIGTYSLAVNGDAIFNKARVKLYGTWPDFVFEEKYGLLPIADLEAFIKANKHLPNVPSAAQVEKEGIDLGGNQQVLLQKIEELTLYIIEQQKQIDELKKKMENK